jgi:hypothetical protein
MLRRVAHEIANVNAGRIHLPQTPSPEWFDRGDDRALEHSPRRRLREVDLQGSIWIMAVFCSFHSESRQRSRELFDDVCDFAYLRLVHGEHEQRDVGLAVFAVLTRKRFAKLEM